MQKLLSVVGISLVLVGTLFGVLNVLITEDKWVGTYKGEDGKQKSEEFRRLKILVIEGLIMVALGSIYQCLAIIFF